MPHCSNKFTHTCVGHLSFALQGESPCHMSAAVSFGNIYLYPFASSLRDGKVEYTYRLKYLRKQNRSTLQTSSQPSQFTGLVTNMPMIIFVFFSFGQLGRRNLVVQLADTDHTQQDVAVHDHPPCSGRCAFPILDIRTAAHDTLAHVPDNFRKSGKFTIRSC